MSSDRQQSRTGELRQPPPLGEDRLGRLARGPHPLLFHLLYEQQFASDRQEVLPWLLDVDAAHVVMLAHTGMLPSASAAALLAVNRELKSHLDRGEPVLAPPPSHRGLYFVYERYLIDRLGQAVGGAAHLARSRNDINSTVTRLRLRDELLALLDSCLDLLVTALSRAATHAGTVMSGFSHLQPAQPTTLGHYLAAVTAELLRGAERLVGSFDEVDRSPLGAGAGFGTALAIDRDLTASLLGFSRVVDNSLDAVASRDYVVPALAALAGLGTTLARLANDLQSWGSTAYGFLRWPDDLVATSSMMPQKRNAFAFESVRGLAVRPAGALAAVLAGLKGTPFSNSVEVAAEATSHLWPALAATRSAVRLTALMLAGLEVDSGRMLEFLTGAETTMTALADELVVRHGLSFRSAHEAVGRLLASVPADARRTAGAVKRALEAIVRETVDRSLELDEEAIARALDPVACARSAGHGGGPAPESVAAQLRALGEGHRTLERGVGARRQVLGEADRRLREAITALCG